MSEFAPSTAKGSDTANIHLQLKGQERTVSVAFRPGQQSARELLPIARELANHITEMAIEAIERQGRTISCRAGCAACCRQIVCISLVDAYALSELIAALPPKHQAIIRNRFAQAIRQLEHAGLLDPNEARGNRRLVSLEDGSDPNHAIRAVASRYFQLQIPCPFLDDEKCSIYDERPLVCREYHVTSPAENCAHLYEIGVEALEVPIRMGEVLVRVAHQVAGASKESIPLVLALEWAEAHPQELARSTDSLQMLRSMVKEIDQEYASAFDQRELEAP